MKFEQFSANLKYGNIKGKFGIKNFVKPQIIGLIKTELDLSELNNFFNNNNIKHITGKIEGEISLKLKLQNFKNINPKDFIKSESYGYFNISNSSIKFTDFDKEVNNLNSNFKFNNKDIDIESLNFKIGESDFSFDGSLLNVLPFIFIDNQKIEVVAKLHSNYLNFDELLKDDKQKSKTGKNLEFSNFINFRINLTSKSLKFGKFNASNIHTDLFFKNQKLLINDFVVNSCGGNIKGSAAIDGMNKNHFVATINSELNNIDISKTFYSFNNFGQNEIDGITDKKIFGKANAKLEMYSVWNKDLTPKMDMLKANGEITIEDGKLLNYEPLKALSKFIKLEDLEVVKFSKLKNKIEINENQIIIPQMDIKSNAVDLQLNGVHKFTNEIEYHLKISLSDILTRKYNKKAKANNELGEIEDDGLERRIIYILITGTTDKPIIKYDKKGNKENFDKDIKKEKQNIKQILNREFGIFSKDTTINKTKNNNKDIKNLKEKQNLEKQEKGKFIIEWDDN